MTGNAQPGRLGILGGTLDPIHLGHIQAAVAAQRALALDAVVIMPARIPPHRGQGPAASTFHRFAMAALAASELSGFSVSDEELRADGPSYTALTLERMSRRGMAPSRLFFITGADAFAEIETWYRYPEVLDLAHFVVVSRPGVPAPEMRERLPHLRNRFRTDVDEAVRPAVFLVDEPTADVSSTEIRGRLRGGRSINGLVPAAVERHILRHRLYSEASTVDH